MRPSSSFSGCATPASKSFPITQSRRNVKMTNIVEFPAADDRPEHQWTEDEVDKIHAEAFRDLEGSISDCVWMSIIALEMVERAIDKGRDDKREKAMFAVCESV